MNMKKLLPLLFITSLLGCSFLPLTANATSNDVPNEVLGNATYCKTEYAPVIDGAIEEIWDYAEELSGTNYFYDESVSSTSGYAKVLWNETNLFLLAVVTTESMNETEADALANGVIFRVSETSSSELTFRTLSGDWEYGITPYGTTFNVLAKDLPMKTEYSAKWNEKTNQYIVELHVPLQTYRLNLEENDAIAFNFFIREDVNQNGDFDDEDLCSAWQTGVEGPNSLSPLNLIKKEINIDLEQNNSNGLSTLQIFLLIGAIVIVAGGATSVIFIRKKKRDKNI